MTPGACSGPHPDGAARQRVPLREGPTDPADVAASQVEASSVRAVLGLALALAVVRLDQANLAAVLERHSRRRAER